MSESDELMEFARLVKNLRTTQKEYFRTRDRVTLQQSKSLESQVDRRCEEILLYTSKSLFDLIEEEPARA